jgi:predicted PurR-regulated permease PerM
MKESEQVVRIKFSIINFISLLAICVASYFLFRISQIIISLFFSLIIMSAIKPIVFWMEKKLRFPRAVSILLVYTCLILLIALAIMVIVPPLVEELPTFIQTLSLPPLPSDLLELKATLSDLSIYLPQIGSSFQTLATLVSSAFNGLLAFVTILVMASYLLIDRERLHLKISWFTKDAHYLHLAKKLIDQVEMQLGGWVRGQLSLMLIIGLITYIGLTLLGIPYALPLALAAGLLEVLPNIGPLIAAVPAIATAFLVGGPALAVFTGVFYILVQQFENNLIVPKLMKDNADVNPLTTIVLILIGFKLGNVVGALLAVPIYIVIRSIYSMWYKERHSTQG